MSNDKFFEKQTASSRIKANIVSEYFPSYCNIIKRKNMPEEIRYVDLFAGPGVYKDGNVSTPILIARQCFQNDFLRQKVKLIFNDNYYSKILEENFINEFPEGTFVKSPFFGNKTVGRDENIKIFLIKNNLKNGKNIYPSLLFIDPFGYKAIETEVLAQFLKYWGNEIFLFVNIKRIHAAIENDKFEDLMKNLFPTTFNKVRNDRRYTSNTPARIKLIVQSLGEEYENILKIKVYYTAFKFQEEDNQATSHYILHLTKGQRGFDLVKQIYNDFANVGTTLEGNNTYTFDAKMLDKESNESLFTKGYNIDNLKKCIYLKYKGRTISALNLFDEHQTENIYCRSHYSSALRKLVSEGKLSVTFDDNVQHKVSVLISKNCILKFN